MIVSAPEPWATVVCDWLAAGRSLASFCRLPGSPSYAQVRHWQHVDPVFANQVNRAREIGQELLVEECVDIADGALSSGDDFRDRLRIETRLRVVAAWNPSRWSPAQRVEHSVARIPMTEDERRIRLEALFGEAQRRLTVTPVETPKADP